METKLRLVSPQNVLRIVNELRREKQLPACAQGPNPTKITREVLRQVVLDVWKKYPQSLTDPHYELGELTLALVDQEIRQRISDLKRGLIVKQAALKDYFN